MQGVKTKAEANVSPNVADARSRFQKKSFVTASAVLIGGAAIWFFVYPGGNSRARAEREHGISLPPSAHHIQCRGDAWRGFLDRGATTIFEMSTNDLTNFVAQLTIRSRAAPTRTTGDPAVNGWNVWPQDSATFVPGNSQYGGLRHTWNGDAVPVEMLSCSSPKGDWLHVEFWRINGGATLVKMHTDWN
jgi:hypothetical protein